MAAYYNEIDRDAILILRALKPTQKAEWVSGAWRGMQSRPSSRPKSSVP